MQATTRQTLRGLASVGRRRARLRQNPALFPAEMIQAAAHASELVVEGEWVVLEADVRAMQRLRAYCAELLSRRLAE